MSRIRWPSPLARALLGLIAASVLALGALSAWLALPGGGPEAGSPGGLSTRLASDKSLGVNTDLGLYSAGRRTGLLQQLEQSGLRWLRLRFPWDAIQPRSDAFDWTLWDEIVSDLHRHNIGIIAVLDGSPAWARDEVDRQNELAPPVEARDFGIFAAAFADRYGDLIDHYQIWDEPNIAPHWGARQVDPAAYGRLLRESAIQIRAADPGSVIVLAALAPNVEPGGANMSELSFLDALYQWGGAEWFDLVAVQPYDFGQDLLSEPQSGRLNWRRAELLRDVMVSHGGENKAVWATSFGWDQAVNESVSDAVLYARQSWPWLGPMLWAALTPEDSRSAYALTTEGGEPGKAFGELETLASMPTTAWPGAYAADHPSGIYEGDWRVTPSGADIGSSGDRLTVAFWGTRLDLVVRRGEYRAFLYATIDGQPANALPRDTSGNAYVVLYDPLAETARETLARDLPAGHHTAEIVADRGWGQWAIAGWQVLREGPGSRPWLPLLLALTALAVLGVTVGLSWPDRNAIISDASGISGALVARYRELDDRLALVITAAAALLVVVAPGTVPALASLALLGTVLLIRPDTGLPLIAIALPFYQPGKPLGGWVFSMVEILTLLTAVGWAINRLPALVSPLWQGGRSLSLRGRRPSALDWGVIALVVLGAVSLLWAEHGREAAREFRTVILEAAIFYGLMRAMVSDRGGAWRVSDAWVLGGSAIALVGILQWAFGTDLITAEGVWRVRGLYGSPNNLALYLGRIFPLAIAVSAWGRHGRRRWLYGTGAVLMAFALLLTYSRGAWLFGVPVSILFLAALRGRKPLLVTVGGLALAAVLLVLIAGPGRLTSLLDTGEGTTFFRIQLWRSSLSMIGGQPVLGVGLDNFLYAYRTHYVLPSAWEEFNLSHPHNFILDFWLRLGLPGLLLVGWLLLAFFRQGWRAYRHLLLEQGEDVVLVMGLVAGMVNFVAHGLVDNAFFLVDLAFTFMLMAALVQIPDWDRNDVPVPVAHGIESSSASGAKQTRW